MSRHVVPGAWDDLLALLKRCQAAALVACPLALFAAAACGPAYRTPALVKGRSLSQQALPAEEYRVYSAALAEFLPNAKKEWVSVTGVTIRAEHIESSVFGDAYATITQDLLSRLAASGDTAYVIGNHFAESLSVATCPVVDTTDWVAIRWQRTMHRSYPAGLISLSRVAIDPGGEWAMVYGLSGTGPVGTGFPRVVLLRAESGAWKVIASRALGT